MVSFFKKNLSQQILAFLIKTSEIPFVSWVDTLLFKVFLFLSGEFMENSVTIYVSDQRAHIKAKLTLKCLILSVVLKKVKRFVTILHLYGEKERERENSLIELPSTDFKIILWINSVFIISVYLGISTV